MQGYNPKEIEQRIYQICKQRGYFEITGNQKTQKTKNNDTQHQHAESQAQSPNTQTHLADKSIHKYTRKSTHNPAQTPKTFCIMMPPPNVTGVLHIGHALTFTLQDIITRYKRMDGYITLYQPGLDHAGIATQNIVEKQLLAQGIKKEDIGREAFIKKVWEWKEESGGKILTQMEALGITSAWSRTRFTMDLGLKSAVREAFVRWYDKGLIIQGDYMVNWCTHDGALSDIEVEYEEQHTFLYHLRYKIQGSDEVLVVATTRPETFFGDTAVMVHTQDSRYKHLIGKNVILPLLDKEIPIIGDDSVDMEFGTGVVKVTPAHDINDYEVGKRHHLPSVVVFDSRGILNELTGEFQGQERLKAREHIIKKLQSLNAIEKIEPYVNQVGKCYRCGNIIEPYISKQWFVKPEIAKGAIERVNNAESRFYPAQWLNNFNAWMRELRPWCISRQLWWGHRIPVWSCECGHTFASKNEVESICPKCQSQNLTQDPDVLDTWFSSGLWAFSTLGWGNGGLESDRYNPDDLELFYPNSLLITGFDILFFWVSRMLFSGESLIGELPFKDIYLHALVRDESGQKMSKSKGNVIDPIEMINQYGADSLRFCLAYLCAQGRDIRLSSAQLELSRNFANKLFNATQFLMMYLQQLGGKESLKYGFEDKEELMAYTTPLGRFAKSRLNLATKELREALDSYRFNDGASVLYRFLWGEFCDWCIEFAKAQKEAIFELGSVLKTALKLLHPYMPFISEELYHKLNASDLENTESIMIAPFPNDIAQDLDLEREFEVIKDCVVSLRRLKALVDLANKPIKKAYINPKSALKSYALGFIQKLARIECVEIQDSRVASCVVDVSDNVESYLPINEIDVEAITKRLTTQEAKIQKEITKLESMLGNKKFVDNAPQEVLHNTQNALNEAKQKIQKIQNEISIFRAV